MKSDPPKAVATASSPPPIIPLDPGLVPLAALAEFDGLVVASTPPCSLTIDTLTPVLDSIAGHRKQLASARDSVAATQLLSELSKELAAGVSAIAPRDESDELRRITAELRASIGDLAESLKVASEAVATQDKQAAAINIRRIHNGVANTRSSIEGLIHQCVD